MRRSFAYVGTMATSLKERIKDHKHDQHGMVELFLLDVLHSGETIEITPEYLEQKRKHLMSLVENEEKTENKT